MSKVKENNWFKGAKLGFFYHFGIASVHGGIDLSWSMIKNTPWCMNDEEKITPKEYFKLAEKFNPVNYNPDKWLKAAKEVGAKYAVLTTRHHDGFALWPSDYGDFSTKNYINGRDLVKEFIEACRKNDIKVGLYYSSPNWYLEKDYKNFSYSGEYLNWEHKAVDPIPLPADVQDKLKECVKGQVTELFSNYGKIDLIWFDGSISDEPAITLDEIRKMQPDMVINDGMKGIPGYKTYEVSDLDKLPDNSEELWECDNIWNNRHWGYTEPGGYKSVEWFLEQYKGVVKKGGNYLPSSAPRKDGTLPDEYYEYTKEIAKWMKDNKELK